MFNSIISLFTRAISAVFSWVSELFVALSITDIFLGLFLVFMTYRFLLSPLIKGGSVGSDKAKKSNNDNEDE